MAELEPAPTSLFGGGRSVRAQHPENMPPWAPHPCDGCGARPATAMTEPLCIPCRRRMEADLWHAQERWWARRDAARYGGEAVLQGVPLPVVSRLLGHRNLRTTLRYAHIGDREAEAAAERVGAAVASALREDRQDDGGAAAAIMRTEAS